MKQSKLSESIRKIPYNLILIGVIAVVAAACASIGNPSGGARDEQPPRFVKANPAPYSTDVPIKIERINLDFDEIVNVKDPSQKVVVSPPSKNIPRVASQGHRVTVTFQDTLLPNTTYTVNFADAIEDNNEGNPLENFSYTFSTGPIVDSLRIAGRVLSAQAMEPMQGKIVGLHKIPADSIDKADSLVFTRPFDRVARTDDRGRFSIEGLAPGRYRIFALDDTNSDYIYSSPDEEFAFYDAIIEPYAEEAIASDTIFNHKLGTVDSVVSRRRSIFLPNDILLRSFLTSRKQQFVSNYSRQDSTRINLIFNAPNIPLPEISIVGSPEMTDWYAMERSVKGDTLALWLKSPEIISTDTLRLSITYQKLDSINRYTATTDTLRFTTDRPRKPKNEKKKKEEEADTLPPPVRLMALDLLGGSTLLPERPVILQTDAPVAMLDSTMFHLEVKKDTLWIPLPTPPIMADSLNPRRFTLSFPRTFETTYRLSVDSLAMESIHGLRNGSFSRELSTKSEKDYCSLQLTIPDWPAGLPAFVEIIDQSDKPLRRLPLTGQKVVFPYLDPGKINLRITADLNNNGEWDSGDIIEGRQAEPTFYYPKTITIKQNWNKEETWRVFDVAADAMKPEKMLKNKPTQRKNRGTSNTGSSEDEEDDDEEYPYGAYGNSGYNRNNGNASQRTTFPR